MAIIRKPPTGIRTDRNLALEPVRVTEAAALAASHWIGHGKKNKADSTAAEAMRKAFDAVAIDGTVVIGEGEMDEAPMLFIGEKESLTIRIFPGSTSRIRANPGNGHVTNPALAYNLLDEATNPSPDRTLHDPR